MQKKRFLTKKTPAFQKMAHQKHQTPNWFLAEISGYNRCFSDCAKMLI